MKTCNTTEQRQKRHKRGRRDRQAFMPHFGNIFHELLNAPLSEVIADSPANFTRPASNIMEQEKAITIEIAIPGFSKSEVEITIDKDVLKVSAQKEKNAEVKFKLREFNYNTFSRAFRLSDKVDQESISAEVKNGVLAITLLKKEEEPAKTIEIK